MRILITGATGLIGRYLVQRLLSLSYQVTILSRSPCKSNSLFMNNVHYWSNLYDKESLDEFDAVINLAGESIIKHRWTSSQKQKLCESRWQLTEQLTNLIKKSRHPPAVFISASATGYYGHQPDTVITEETPAKDSFLSRLCLHWEQLALQASSEKTRVCILRTGIVLAADDGALPKMLPYFRWGLGAQLSNGKQYISWIHIEDMIDGILFLLTHDSLQGSFNLTSPNPVTNKEFTKTVAKALQRPTLFTIPAFLLRILFGESSTLFLDSQRIYPKHLIDAGFSFYYPELSAALKDLV